MWLQVGEQSGQVAGFFNHGPRSFFDLYTQFIGHNATEGCLTQSRGAMKKNMVQRLAADAGRLNEDFKILNSLCLPGKIGYFAGTDIVLKLLVSSTERFLVNI